MMTQKQTVLPGRYVVVPRVLVFVFDPQGQVLLIKGDENKKIWPNLWNGLGGHVEKGETQLEAAQRELYEESSLIATNWCLCAQVMIETDQEQGISMWVFRATASGVEMQPSQEGIIAWHPIQEALGLDLVEDLYALLPVVADFKGGDEPLWGHYRYDERDQLVMRFFR